MYTIQNAVFVFYAVLPKHMLLSADYENLYFQIDNLIGNLGLLLHFVLTRYICMFCSFFLMEFINILD